MRLEIDIAEHHYNNIMALDSVSLGRVPYKGIIMYSINAIKHGKVLEQEPRKMVGSWIKSRDSYGNNHFTCPFCEHDIATKADTLGDNYCSNCGAKLQESEEV